VNLNSDDLVDRLQGQMLGPLELPFRQRHIVALYHDFRASGERQR
jgi:hypothetical protein